MEGKCYFYDYRYWTLEEIRNMYRELSVDKKKLFRESLSHYSLAEILKICDYDRNITYTLLRLAGEEVDRMNLIGVDCGRILLGYDRRYQSLLRKLINFTGELVFKDEDNRMTSITSGEKFLNNLICHTIGNNYQKELIDDFELIEYNSLSDEECLAIADNFYRFMKNEEFVFYDKSKKLNKK